ncbi:MAG: DUF3800 domain-containing protein [Amphiplicatus sp.]
MKLDYEYVAYIDESGDDGLSAVKPISNPGSSEWLILSAVVVRRANERLIPGWINELTSGFKNHQKSGVHFADLNPAKRRRACSLIAEKDARFFVVASNKKNMQGYDNPAAGKIPSSNWFYCWLTRVLLERVTYFAMSRALRDFGCPRFLKLEYSARGGLSYSQMTAYYEWMRLKRHQFLPWGNVYFDVLSPDLLKVYPHTERAGLQMADIVAGAFFKACDIYDTGGVDPQFAKLLRPRMAHVKQKIAGFGLKLLPKLSDAKLTHEQAEIFHHYGYPKQWWDPASFS